MKKWQRKTRCQVSARNSSSQSSTGLRVDTWAQDSTLPMPITLTLSRRKRREILMLTSTMKPLTPTQILRERSSRPHQLISKTRQPQEARRRLHLLLLKRTTMRMDSKPMLSLTLRMSTSKRRFTTWTQRTSPSLSWRKKSPRRSRPIARLLKTLSNSRMPPRQPTLRVPSHKL